MNTNRRNFLKKAAMGSAAISSAGGLILNNMNTIDPANDSTQRTDPENAEPKSEKWKIFFDTEKSELSLVFGDTSLTGTLKFASGTQDWTITKSRDGLPFRYGLVNPDNNVMGYFVFSQKSGQLQLIFYHRTEQYYQGTLTFEGKISFLPDSFPCRTRAKSGERVLSMSCGFTDSLLNDSLFSPEKDTILRIDSGFLRINRIAAGLYSFVMSGQIHESSQAAFTFNYDKDYFKERYVPYYHTVNRKRCPKTPTGWMSWNVYFDTATADDNLAEAKVGQKFLLPFGCEFWSIESWQENSDKLPVQNFHNMNLETSKRKFPKGMKKLSDDIRKLGFRPGIWIPPFGTGNDEFYQAHKSWFLHDKDGKPYPSWNGRYTLDPTVPEAREHLKEMFRTASRDWGYEFFKIDAVSGKHNRYSAHLYEIPAVRTYFHDPSCPNPLELCIKAFREGIGEDRVFLSGQGHTTGPDPLYADAYRIGSDVVSANNPPRWRNVLGQGRSIINQAFTHNIVMIADPDTLMVHDLPLEEARVMTTVVALPGQVTFFGDKLAGLTESQMKMLQQTLPVAEVRPMSLYPYFSMLPVWNLRIQNSMLDDYNVVALFNWMEEPEVIQFTTGELGVESDKRYVLYEFWTNRYIGYMTETFSMEVPPHSVRLLSMHLEKPVPQWISSDRHVTQNSMELKEYAWKNDSRTLLGKIQLIGTFPLTMRLRIPDEYSLDKAECEGAVCEVVSREKNLISVLFKANKTGDYPFSLKF